MSSAQEKLRGTIVLRDHLLGHVTVLVHFGDAGQAKVANLEQTIAIDKQVAGLDIAMNDTSRVQLFDATQDLVQEELDMVLCEHLWTRDDFVKIALHELGEYVDLVKEINNGRLKNVDGV